MSTVTMIFVLNLAAFLFKAYFDYYIMRRRWLNSPMGMIEAVWILLTCMSVPVFAVYKLIT